jgi:mRNA-degrading endonuclease RelE of RelBE toxin-antitoxin system
MARNDDLLGLSLAKVARQIVLDLGKGHFLHAGFANCASQQYRLRVGDVRVFYDVSAAGVEILSIVAKSEAESLAFAGRAAV